jgi:hypothetical protein
MGKKLRQILVIHLWSWTIMVASKMDVIFKDVIAAKLHILAGRQLMAVIPI